PSAVFAAIVFDAVVACMPSVAGRARTTWIVAAIASPLLLQSGLVLSDLSIDRQEAQRRTINAVHQIFPEPVPYVDHSAMIASFPKVNFFMSTWGVERYRERGMSFMEPALMRHRPKFVLANQAVLFPGAEQFDRLLPVDRELIVNSYVRYWGPIFVAGSDIELPPLGQGRVTLPFPGGYRVEADQPVEIANRLYAGGDVLQARDDELEFVVRNLADNTLRIRVVWQGAQQAPVPELPPIIPLYSNL
ncbi:MAG: hypothetical protein R3305_09705, partial [Gammaproteobacteria bacterium]|nr:hypothetical protein [Gammaproteobacteria bacterium]